MNMSHMFCIFGMAMVTTASELQWGYTGAKGPDNWEKVFKEYCGGQKQSPINLNPSESEEDPNLQPLKITPPKAGSKFKVSNNGHTISLDISAAEMNIQQKNGKGFEYRAQVIHWHWGSINKQGSEHTLRGTRYGMESHLVCWDKTKYKNFKDASASTTDGLAVFSVLYQVDTLTEKLNKLFDEVTKTFGTPYIKQCKVCGNGAKTKELDSFPLEEYLISEKYWRYNGSLTTPDCRETVMWTVFDTPVKISGELIAKFRKLLYPSTGGGAAKPMVDNFRKIKPLNPPRKLFRSFSA